MKDSTYCIFDYSLAKDLKLLELIKKYVKFMAFLLPVIMVKTKILKI